jgi:hypothetical protein
MRGEYERKEKKESKRGADQHPSSHSVLPLPCVESGMSSIYLASQTAKEENEEKDPREKRAASKGTVGEQR